MMNSKPASRLGPIRSVNRRPQHSRRTLTAQMNEVEPTSSPHRARRRVVMGAVALLIALPALNILTESLASAAPVLVQSASGQNSNSTPGSTVSLSATLGSACTAGDTLIAMITIGQQDDQGGMVSVTPAGWQRLFEHSPVDTSPYQGWFALSNCGGVTNATFSVTAPGDTSGTVGQHRPRRVLGRAQPRGRGRVAKRRVLLAEHERHPERPHALGLGGAHPHRPVVLRELAELHHPLGVERGRVGAHDPARLQLLQGGQLLGSVAPTSAGGRRRRSRSPCWCSRRAPPARPNVVQENQGASRASRRGP